MTRNGAWAKATGRDGSAGAGFRNTQYLIPTGTTYTNFQVNNNPNPNFHRLVNATNSVNEVSSSRPYRQNGIVARDQTGPVRSLNKMIQITRDMEETLPEIRRGTRNISGQQPARQPGDMKTAKIYANMKSLQRFMKKGDQQFMHETQDGLANLSTAKRGEGQPHWDWMVRRASTDNIAAGITLKDDTSSYVDKLISMRKSNASLGKFIDKVEDPEAIKTQLSKKFDLKAKVEKVEDITNTYAKNFVTCEVAESVRGSTTAGGLSGCQLLRLDWAGQTFFLNV